MIRLNLSSPQRRIVAMVAMALAIVMAGDVIYQTIMHVVWHRWINHYTVAAAPATQPATQPATAPANQAKPPIQLSALIRKRNLFAPPVIKGHQLTLTGVLGRLAFFRSKSGESVTIEEGKSDRGVTVKAINGYEVTIEYEGKPQVMKLFDPKSGGAPPGGAGPPMSAHDRPGRPVPPQRPGPGGPRPPATSRPAPMPAPGPSMEYHAAPAPVEMHMEVPPAVMEMRFESPPEIDE